MGVSYMTKKKQKTPWLHFFARDGEKVHGCCLRTDSQEASEQGFSKRRENRTGTEAKDGQAFKT